MSDKVCVVVGVGPGLGGAAAVAFAEAGYRVASVARREASVREWGERLEVHAEL